MYCPKCGTANDDASRFCASCGLDLSPYQAQPETSGQPPHRQPSQEAPPFQQQHQDPYQQAYQQPYQQPYQQTYPGQQYRSPGYGAVPRIPSYMGWAIAVLILCFWPTGIAAVVHASRVNSRLALGDVAGAQESSRKAKMWCWITFAIAVVWVVIVIIAAAAGWITASGYLYYN